MILLQVLAGVKGSVTVSPFVSTGRSGRIQSTGAAQIIMKVVHTFRFLCYNILHYSIPASALGANNTE